MLKFEFRKKLAVMVCLFALLALPPMVCAATINYDINTSSGGNYTGTAVASDSGTVWNSAVISGSTSSFTLANVSDSFGNATGSSITITNIVGANISRYSDSSAGNGDPNPVALMQDYTFSGTYLVTITGLTVGTYTLYAFAHGNVANQNGTITLNAANGGASGTEGSTGTEYRNIFTSGSQGYSYLYLNGTVSGTGVFSFTVANFLNGFQLQQITAPAISGLTNQTVVSGTATTLNPTITGTAPFYFQWRSNSIALAGQTNASLVLNNVQYAQNGTAYSLVVTNPAGMVTNSMTLTVIVTPAIAGLNNQAVSTGTTVAIPATVSGVPAPALRWQFNGSNVSDGATGHGSTIAGSAASTLYITNAQAADTGTYSLIATNTAGVVTNSMTLTVSSGNVAPSITGPTDQTAVQTSNATFSASVSGLPLPTLQWSVNGGSIINATNSTLTVSNVQYSQNNYIYSLVTSNAAGMATNNATLYVLVPPAISAQPTNLSVTVGVPGTFNVTASGVPAVKYQWNRNGASVANATNASYTISNPQGADNGAVFSVVVSNSVGVVISSNATLTVLSTTLTGTFLPTNGAVNISPDQQLRITFSGGTPQLAYRGKKLHVFDATNNSLFATIDTSQFQTYAVDGATVSNAFVRAEQGRYFYYMPIAIYGNQAWITLNSTNRFAYGHTYYVTFDSGLFLDSTGAAFPGITATNVWRFSTKASGPTPPTASTGPTNITVGLDGAGDFATLQGASDWIPQNNTLHRIISIQPGVYHDNTCFLQSRTFVTVTGTTTNRNDVQFICPSASYGPQSSSSGNAATLIVESSDMDFHSFTVDNQVYVTNSLNNSGPFAGRLLVLITLTSRLVFDNVAIKGGQDTYYATGSSYFYHCEIWGSVDFIYGSALLVFDQCNIVQIRSSGGPCTAPNTAYAQPYGMVFLNCTFPLALVANGYPYDVNAGGTTFQRAWGQDGMTTIFNCAVGSQISTAGWGTFGSGSESTARAREYGTTLIGGGTAPTIVQRQAAGTYWLNTLDPDYTNNPSLSPTDPLVAPPTGTNNRVAVTINPNDYTLSAIFGNSYFNLNGWMPTVIPTITLQPTNQMVSAGAATTFTVAATGVPSPTFQWQKNGTNLIGATNAMLSFIATNVANSGTYSVIVSNTAGTMVSSNAVLSVANSAPSLAPISGQTINAGTTLIVTNVATDIDAPPQTLTFSLLTGPLNSTLNASGVFNWRPSANQSGTTNPVSVKVMDDGTPSLSATNTFKVIVNPVSKPSLGVTTYNGTQLSVTVNSGTVGPDYVVEVSTNLTGWQTMLTTNSPPQPFTFTDAMSVTTPTKFYRVRLSP